jgi:RNA polymerase sigma factor (sigma-70 family)
MTEWELMDLSRAIAGDMLRKGQIPFPMSTEDLVQSGLLSALMAMKRYDPDKGASLRTFLGIRIRGAIRDEIERQMRTYIETSYNELDEISKAPANTETPERYAIHHERLTRLIIAINRLPKRWQELLLLRYYGEQTQRQIASDLKITEARVSQLYSNIIGRLRVQV